MNAKTPSRELYTVITVDKKVIDEKMVVSEIIEQISL